MRARYLQTHLVNGNCVRSLSKYIECHSPKAVPDGTILWWIVPSSYLAEVGRAIQSDHKIRNNVAIAAITAGSRRNGGPIAVTRGRLNYVVFMHFYYEGFAQG